MSKPWSERPLYWKVFMSDDRAHLFAGLIINHGGMRPTSFYDAARKKPGYTKHRYEMAVRDLTEWSRRESPDPMYVLTAHARKVLRIIIGPAPDDPEYASWWRARLVSVKADRERGVPVEWAFEPPVPLTGEDEPVKAARPKRKPRRSPAKAAGSAAAVGKPGQTGRRTQ